MSRGKIIAICICPNAGDPMTLIDEVQVIRGRGLEGDRYAGGKGSFGQVLGKRQVTLINASFFPGSGYEFVDSRRNIVTEGVELMWLIGRKFQIGEAYMRGIKYCDPCERPRKLSNNENSFAEAFYDRGGLIAKVIKGGIIRVGDSIIPPPKGY